MSDQMKGMRGLIMGVANDRSIAWGIAKEMAAAGAELAFSYQGEAFGKRVLPLAQSLGSDFVVDMDVTDEESMDRGFAELRAKWPKIDFVVHAIAFSNKDELGGRFINTSRENFKNSLDISCFSLIDVARRSAPLMKEGGTILTLTYQGSTRVTPYYNVMGVAKAALESATRYMAAELGPKGIRVHALSPGPLMTRAASGIAHFDQLLNDAADRAPTHHLATIEDVGAYAAFLASREAANVTGGVHYVDGGYHIVA